MKKPIYIVCGVPGSGKSWVCNQLKSDFQYIPHDGWNQRIEFSNSEYLNLYAEALVEASKNSAKPILGDCPFAERLLKQELVKKGANVTTVFVTADPKVLIERYVERNKPIPKGHLTRASSIKERAKDWGSFCGTSDEVLKYIRQLISK